MTVNLESKTLWRLPQRRENYRRAAQRFDYVAERERSFVTREARSCPLISQLEELDDVRGRNERRD